MTENYLQLTLENIDLVTTKVEKNFNATTKDVKSIKHTTEVTSDDVKAILEIAENYKKEREKEDENKKIAELKELKKSVEKNISDALKNYGLFSKYKGKVGKEIFKEIWNRLKEENITKWDLETGSKIDEAIEIKINNLKNSNPDYFEDHLENHESKIVRDLAHYSKDLVLENIICKDIIKEKEIEIKRLNKKIDEELKAIKKEYGNKIDISIDKYFDR